MCTQIYWLCTIWPWWHHLPLKLLNKMNFLLITISALYGKKYLSDTPRHLRVAKGVTRFVKGLKTDWRSGLVVQVQLWSWLLIPCQITGNIEPQFLHLQIGCDNISLSAPAPLLTWFQALRVHLCAWIFCACCLFTQNVLCSALLPTSAQQICSIRPCVQKTPFFFFFHPQPPSELCYAFLEHWVSVWGDSWHPATIFTWLSLGPNAPSSWG